MLLATNIGGRHFPFDTVRPIRRAIRLSGLVTYGRTVNVFINLRLGDDFSQPVNVPRTLTTARVRLGL